MMLDKSRTHIAILAISTALCAFSFGSIIKFTDPFTAGFSVHALFYITLFLMSAGFFTVLGILIRQRFFYGIYIVNLKISVRQAILVSTLLTASAILQGRGLLFWWVQLLLILFIIAVEIFFNV